MIYITKEQNSLIERNIGLVRHTIAKYYPRLLQDEDLYQVACLGLIKSSRLYNSEKGKFSTYAVLGIKYAIRNHFSVINTYKRQSNILAKSLDNPINMYFEISLTNLIKAKDFTNNIHFKIALNEIFKRLKLVDKKILAMRLAGYTFDEVGQAVSLTKQSVYWRVRTKIKPVAGELLRETKGLNILGRSKRDGRS